MSDVAIQVEEVSKRFLLHRERRTGIKERLVRGRAPSAQEFWALRDATFSIPRGTTFGLLGPNGSGKSTTLKVLAGIYRPTSGRVVVDGRVTALLELGAGFHGELTGRENVRLNGAILGLTRRQVDAAMDRIVDFAGIGEFIDSPVKIYSSGMFVRLGFAVAVSLDPQILMVDEVIAVGDEEFQRKCFDHLLELRNRGTTVVLVTHSLVLIEDLCDTAAWLDHGSIQQLGPAHEVAAGYLESVNENEITRQDVDQDPELRDLTDRRGSGEARVTRVEYLSGDGSPSPLLLSGAPCTVRLHYETVTPISRVEFGLAFQHESGVNVAGPNSRRAGPFQLVPGKAYVDFEIPELLLKQGSYRVTTAIVDRGHTYDYLDRHFALRVREQDVGEPGLILLPGTWRPPVVAPGSATRNRSSVIEDPSAEV